MTLSITTLSITTLSITTLSITSNKTLHTSLGHSALYQIKRDTEHNDTKFNNSDLSLNVIYAKCPACRVSQIRSLCSVLFCWVSWHLVYTLALHLQPNLILCLEAKIPIFIAGYHEVFKTGLTRLDLGFLDTRAIFTTLHFLLIVQMGPTS